MIFNLITNNTEIAKYAINCGVNRIFIDMEYLGKDVRQGHLDTHKVQHTPNDVEVIRRTLPETEIITRINPIYNGSSKEINDVIDAGSNLIMLPMFTTAQEVKQVINLIEKRNKLCLLLETPQALVRIDEILKLSDYIDEIHIGLNDLHLEMGLNFMFELLSGGIVEYLSNKIRDKGIRFGFGGIARIGEGDVAAELILGEHARLGSDMVILSRTFHQNATRIEDLKKKIDLNLEITKLNETFHLYKNASDSVLHENRIKLYNSIQKLVKKMQNKKH